MCCIIIIKTFYALKGSSLTFRDYFQLMLARRVIMPKYCVLLPGQHTPAMYQEHAGKLYQAQAHCPRWLHLRWPRVLDIAGMIPAKTPANR